MTKQRRILPCRHLDRLHLRSDGNRRDERGAGTVLTMIVILIVAMAAFVAACLLSWFGHMHQARSAADLAALAGADAYAGGRDACATAALAATGNGAGLTACTVDSNGVDFIVRVTVQVDAKPHLAFGPGQFTYSSEAGNLP